jgi:hypothetical protein
MTGRERLWVRGFGTSRYERIDLLGIGSRRPAPLSQISSYAAAEFSRLIENEDQGSSAARGPAGMTIVRSPLY